MSRSSRVPWISCQVAQLRLLPGEFPQRRAASTNCVKKPSNLFQSSKGYVVEFDKELNAIALRRESELPQWEFPLHRRLTLPDTSAGICRARRSCSTVQAGAWSGAARGRLAAALPLTDETHVPFQWLA